MKILYEVLFSVSLALRMHGRVYLGLPACIQANPMLILVTWSSVHDFLSVLGNSNNIQAVSYQCVYILYIGLRMCSMELPYKSLLTDVSKPVKHVQGKGVFVHSYDADLWGGRVLVLTFWDFGRLMETKIRCDSWPLTDPWGLWTLPKLVSISSGYYRRQYILVCYDGSYYQAGQTGTFGHVKCRYWSTYKFLTVCFVSRYKCC